MKCPKCGGEIKVCCTTYTEENEIYRRRKCFSCGHVFYTMEFEVEENPAFRKEWGRLRRTAKPAHARKNRKTYTLYLRDDGSVIASGTSEECAQQMGITSGVFRSIISRTNRGIIKRYEAEIRDCKEELEEE